MTDSAETPKSPIPSEEKDRSGYYDIISDPAKRLAHEGDFLTRLLSLAPGPRVLDMAAATGVHAEFLARNGALVTARDIDEKALAYARENRGHERVTYEMGDMRAASGGPFDLVVVMGNAVSMLPSAADVTEALRAMAAELSPEGIGFVHVFNYEALDAGGPRQKIAHADTERGEIVVVKNMLPGGESAGALVSFSYFEREGKVWETWGGQSVLLDLRRERMRTAIGDAGLRVAEEYGDYDLSPFEAAESPDYLAILRKT